MSEDTADDFLEQGADHGYQHVRRITGRFGPEDYFTPDVYHFCKDERA